MLRLSDLIVAPLYFLVIFFVAKYVEKRKMPYKPYYSYYWKGLMLKLVGGVAVCLIYALYYQSGDTINFFYKGADILLKVFTMSPYAYLKVVFGAQNTQNWSVFNSYTGWPYYFKDSNAFFITRLSSLIALFTFGSYIATTLIMSWLSYSGLWRLFLVFRYEFPQYEKECARAVLFIPSVFFWGSGLLKDTVTLSAVGWFTYSFYFIFMQRHIKFKHFVNLFLASYLIFIIKPYILYALLPGVLVWLSGYSLKRIKGVMLRIVVIPLLMALFAAVGFLLIRQVGNDAGKFSVDKILQNAVITQQDLKREYYGENSFDIGDFDASIPSMLAKAPIATISGLFRPFLYEVRNPVMLISALENTAMLLLTISFIVKGFTGKAFTRVSKFPILVFSIVFSLTFAFSVGLTTPNFGALVRYRIPLLPFFASTLLIIRKIESEDNFESLKSKLQD